MEYVSSGDLLSNMEADPEPIPRKAVTFLCAEVVLGLNFLHKNRIIYRDLKQENILVLPGKLIIVQHWSKVAVPENIITNLIPLFRRAH